MSAELINVMDEYRTQQFVHQNYNMSFSIMDHFNRCRERNLYTDVQIKVEDRIFPCHRILLDACCPFFTSYFSFSEQQKEGNAFITITDISAVAFNELLNYIYTTELTITTDTVVDILQCADFLQLRTIVKSCSGFLLQHINLENCFKVHQIADRHSLYHLAEQAWFYILEHFQNLAQSDDLCKISIEMMTKIVSNDFLNVSNEETIVSAIEKWVYQDFVEREKHVPELLKFVRLDRADMSVLDNRILSNIELDKREQNTPRLNKVLVLVSRDTNPRNNVKSDIIWYDAFHKSWEKLSCFPFNHRQLFGVAVVNNNIYITGGVSNEVPLFDSNKIVYNECWEFNVRSSSWQEIKPMYFARFNHATTGFLNSVYVVGGRGQVGSTLRGDGESYDLNSQQWTRISSIRGVDGVGNAALVPLDGKLFLLGGMYSHKTQLKEIRMNNYEEAQYYDPDDKLWHELPALTRHIQQDSLRITGVDCLAVNGFLICIDDNRGKYIKLYNPVTNVMSNFILCHGYHRFAGSSVINNKLISTGGLEVPFLSHDMVHYFDFTNPGAGWNMMPPLRVPMSNHACVTIFKN